jgi:hypothetical protein
VSNAILIGRPNGQLVFYFAFFRGNFAPFLRASEIPIAIACFTFPPCPDFPDRSVPLFFRQIFSAYHRQN